ncbi:MAG TPA: hypothetical protein VIP09_12830 [Dehalococcoidia bacterium]|jgi:hypothetical protein
MDFMHERLGFPRRLSSRLWLITLPSALVSFERRTDVPKLPGTGSRALGGMLLAAGVGLGIFSMRQPDTSISYDGPLAPVVTRPATMAGLTGLAGTAFILRSTTLLLYSLGLACVGGSGQVTLEEPSGSTLLGHN